MPNPSSSQTNNGANLGYEAELFRAADKLRGNMEPSDYKHVVLGLIFLKHISDRFEARRQELIAEFPGDEDILEDRDEYAAENVFWVPQAARWSYLQANAKQPTIGKLIDEAMLAIEKDNPSLQGVLPKEYARPALNAVMLGELIDLISNIALGEVQKFIVDAQLPMRLAKFLNEQGYNTLHTKDLPLQNATPDTYINNLSIHEQRVVITKNADFVESFLLRQIPYKLLLVSTGNIKNFELEALFQSNLEQLVDLLASYSYIELGKDAIIVHQ